MLSIYTLTWYRYIHLYDVYRYITILILGLLRNIIHFLKFCNVYKIYKSIYASKFYVFLTCISVQFLQITNLTHNSFFIYIYSNSLHVSSTAVLIFRKINCINTTSRICHCKGGARQVWRFGYNRSSTPTCTVDGHLHTVTYTRCRINTIDSPDDEHSGARNMKRIGINGYENGIVRQVCYL
jgi:hypothetical protein